MFVFLLYRRHDGDSVFVYVNNETRAEPAWSALHRPQHDGLAGLNLPRAVHRLSGSRAIEAQLAPNLGDRFQHRLISLCDSSINPVRVPPHVFVERLQ